jgi:hypothetical protein
MSTENLLLLGLAGVGLWLLWGDSRTNSPTMAAGTGTVYVPPQQAVPSWMGRASSAAPGAAAWGLVPPQPTDAQQAAQVISAIGALGTGIGNAASGISDALGNDS